MGGFMRIVIVTACVVLIMSCGENKVSLGPAGPSILYGDYSGTISFQQYAGTDSSRAGTDSIYFTFYSDTTYYFNLFFIGDCGYGDGPYEMSNKLIRFENHMYYPAICGIGPGEFYFVIGEYNVNRDRNELILMQDIAALALSFEIDLKRTSQKLGLL